MSIHVIPERSLTLDNQLILLALRVLHCHPGVHSYLKKTSLRDEMCSISDQMWPFLLLLYYEWYLYNWKFLISGKFHVYLSDELLAKEVANLDEGAALSDGTVDGEMRVHSAHFVQVALKNIFQ